MMTEREFGAVAAGLKKFWWPEGEAEFSFSWSPHPAEIGGLFSIRQVVASNIRFQYERSGENSFQVFMLAFTERDKVESERTLVRAYFHCDSRYSTPQEILTRPSKKDVTDFFTSYRSFFRRNCWLSGCDIEATAHEKAEWMQDFTADEIKYGI